MATEISPNRFTKIYLLLWGICIFVGLILLIFYNLGYRLTNHLAPVKVGSIELSSNEDNLQIFLNNREKKTPPTQGIYKISNLTPGTHSIVISKESFWPWAKTVTVADNTVRSLYAFIFPMDGIPTKTLSLNSPEYSYALKTISKSSLPELKPDTPTLLPGESLSAWLDTNAPLHKISHDKSTALYLEDNTIYVAWISDTEPPPHYFCEENPCKLVMPVIVPNDPVKSVDFYKDRNDVVLFTSGAAIYAVEVDREGTQNFQPIYKGNDPSFYQTASSTLYIKDGNIVSSASL